MADYTYKPTTEKYFYKLDNWERSSLIKSRLSGYQLHKLQTREHAIDRYNAYQEILSTFDRIQKTREIITRINADIEKLEKELREKKNQGTLAYEKNPTEHAEIMAIKQRTLEALQESLTLPHLEHNQLQYKLKQLEGIVFDAEYLELIKIVEQCNHFIEFYSKYKTLVSERLKEKEDEHKGNFPEEESSFVNKKLAKLEYEFLPTIGDDLEGIE